MEKIKVGLFSQYYPIYREGVFRHLLASSDFDFSFFAGPPPRDGFIIEINLGEDKFHPIQIFKLHIPGTKNYVTYRSRVISSFIKHQFDIFVLSNDILGIDIWICAILSKFRKVPLILWGQGISRPPTRFRDTLRYLLTSLTSAALYYTEGGKAYWVDRGIPKEKLFVAYNSLDTDKQIFTRENLSQNDLNTFLDAQNLHNKSVVTFLGRLIPEKKPWIFLESIQKTLIIEPDIIGLFIGDGPERQQLENQARKLGIYESVRFVGAVYDENILAKYLLSSIAVVIPAFSGLAIQHAAVYGTPLVLGDLPNSHGPEQEIVVHEITGIRCPDEDVGAFASAIIRLIQDRNFRRTLSDNLLSVIDEKYNVQRMAQGFFDAIEYCIRE